MANFGLQIREGPILMADELAKAFTGGADERVKYDLARSKIWNDEYQNRLYQAQAAQEAQKTADLQKRRAALDAAGPAVGESLAGRVPIIVAPSPQFTAPPLPVDPRLGLKNQGAFAGARPGIVAPENYAARSKQYALDVEAERLLGPAIVQSATTADDLAQGVGRSQGDAALLGPSDPESQRRAMLLKGLIPTTTTVTSGADTIGVDAATRQAVQTAAGTLPSDIALAQAKAKAEADAAAAANPAGTAGAGPAAVHLAALKAKPPGSLTPEEQQLIPLLQGMVDKETAVTPGEKGTIWVPDGQGGWKQVGGPKVDPNARQPAYSSNAVGADSKNIITDTSYKMQTGEPIYRWDAVKYRTAYESEHPDHKTIVKDTNTGQTFEYPPSPPPPDLPTPDEVDAAVVADGAGSPAIVSSNAAPAMPGAIARLGASPPAGTPVVPAFVGRKTLGGSLAPVDELSSPPIGTEFQQKSRTFSMPLLNATIDLDKITRADQLPGRAQAAVINATSGVPSGGTSMLGEYGTLLARDFILGEGDDPSKLYERALNAYIGPELYQLSGMAIKPEEFARQMSANAPAYGDGPETLARKTVDRHNFIKAVVDGGYAGNDKEKAKIYALAATAGIDLTSFTLYDGNKTVMMPARTAAQIAAIAAGVKGAPGTPDAAVGATLPTGPEPATPAAAPAIVAPGGAPAAAGAATAKDGKPYPATPQGYTEPAFRALFDSLAPDRAAAYRKNLGEP